ncbi:MAG: CcmD family protein [Clostridia bacterium]|nr:CcmD family protein [Deltaproteobacteria bacterium]
MIQGGWDYVIAAYAIVWGGLGLYAISLALRLRKHP